MAFRGSRDCLQECGFPDTNHWGECKSAILLEMERQERDQERNRYRPYGIPAVVPYDPTVSSPSFKLSPEDIMNTTKLYEEFIGPKAKGKIVVGETLEPGIIQDLRYHLRELRQELVFVKEARKKDKDAFFNDVGNLMDMIRALHKRVQDLESQVQRIRLPRRKLKRRLL